MVLKPDAVRQRLARLEEVVTRLEGLAADPAAGGELRDWAVERGLQLGAEILFDVGNHVLATAFGAPADDYAGILTALGERGVLSEGLHERLLGLGGFRNILVHGYLRLDRSLVEKHLRAAPGDFTAFAEAIEIWLRQRGDSTGV